MIAPATSTPHCGDASPRREAKQIDESEIKFSRKQTNARGDGPGSPIRPA